MGDPARDDDPPDFELRKYELDRAHELELNKFAHALEVERLKILQLVNAGAFTVLIAFAAGIVRMEGTPRALAVIAGLSWVLGLAAAALATHLQLKAQASINKAYRHRRNAVESRRLSAAYGTARAALMITPVDKTQEKRDVQRDLVIEAEENEGTDVVELDTWATGDEHDELADQAFYRGVSESKFIGKLAGASIGLFMLGGVLLAFSLASADPSQLEPPAKAAP